MGPLPPPLGHAQMMRTWCGFAAFWVPWRDQHGPRGRGDGSRFTDLSGLGHVCHVSLAADFARSMKSARNSFGAHLEIRFARQRTRFFAGTIIAYVRHVLWNAVVSIMFFCTCTRTYAHVTYRPQVEYALFAGVSAFVCPLDPVLSKHTRVCLMIRFFFYPAV